MKESERKAKNKYKQKIVVLHVELYPTDTDILSRITERLEAGEPKASYIKRLIREDIQRSNNLRVMAEGAILENTQKDGR